MEPTDTVFCVKTDPLTTTLEFKPPPSSINDELALFFDIVLLKIEIEPWEVLPRMRRSALSKSILAGNRRSKRTI